MSERIAGLIRVACFFVPMLFVAVGIAVPALLLLAGVLIALVNNPGSLYDTEFIPDLVRAGAGTLFLGVLAYVAFRIAGARKRLKAGLILGPVFVGGVVTLFLLLGVLIAIEGAIGDDGGNQSRFEAFVWIGVIALVATLTIVMPVIVALRYLAGVRVVHPYMSLAVWFGLAVLLITNVGEKPQSPETAAIKAAKRDAALARVSSAPPDAAELAFKYRPLLLYDTDEKRSPLDADEFLQERGSDGEPAHELCTSTGVVFRSCTRIESAADLGPPGQDPGSVLALDVNPAPRARDEFHDQPTAQRIYYHVDADDPDGRIHLDYWILYRYNDSPKFGDHTCLSGLSFKELTCFDHEGDWEGITVSLTRDRRPQSVVYVGHAWRYRYWWDDLRALRVIDGSRPRVWVARGSHASYPAPCGRNVSCRQPDSDIPDGDRDGRKEWPLNRDGVCRAADCLRQLPIGPDGRIASWNGFAGYWGAARCTAGTQLCTRSQGPETPPFQGRYADPGGKGPERRTLRQWYRRAVDRLPPPNGA